MIAPVTLRPFPLGNLASESKHADLLPKKESFDGLIQREMARADRNSHSFSVVVFDMRDVECRHEARKCLQRIQSRTRLTDELGWADRERVGVFLADTGEPGVHHFLRRVDESIQDLKDKPSRHFYLYPSQDDPDSHTRDNTSSVPASGEKRPSAGRQADSAEAPSASSDIRAGVASAARGIESLVSRRSPSWKRIIDVGGSLAAITLFSPVMVCIALFIKATSKGPVLFRQERVGQHGKRFDCLKFRTMHINSAAGTHRKHLSHLIESDAPMTKLDADADPRIIPLGKLLRKTGLDELPQLFNILAGEMSLVGPRPCIPYEYDEYDRWHRRRVDALPGLTGLWQVSGKNKTSFAQMIRYDIAYARKQSILLDAAIIAKTLPAILDQVFSDSKS